MEDDDIGLAIRDDLLKSGEDEPSLGDLPRLDGSRGDSGVDGTSKADNVPPATGRALARHRVHPHTFFTAGFVEQPATAAPKPPGRPFGVSGA
jgi:hypothetical protein